MPSPAASRANIARGREKHARTLRALMPSPAHVALVGLIAAGRGVTASAYCVAAIDEAVQRDLEELKKQKE